ncbi:MAG: metalloregulator ArsR/SmtB family transcription factor [Fibrobacter sp.]|nr:metalloregulator ArsR/SmtB family transcription factor [Fibrobacter sp.]
MCEKLKMNVCETPDETELNLLTDFFKVLGDPTRVKILFRLFQSEICVGELAEKMQITDSAVSHQLHVLKISGLVKKRREGKTIFYTIADEHVRSVIAQGLEHIEEK